MIAGASALALILTAGASVAAPSAPDMSGVGSTSQTSGSASRSPMPIPATALSQSSDYQRARHDLDAMKVDTRNIDRMSPEKLRLIHSVANSGQTPVRRAEEVDNILGNGASLRQATPADAGTSQLVAMVRMDLNGLGIARVDVAALPLAKLTQLKQLFDESGQGSGGVRHAGVDQVRAILNS